MKLVFRSQDPVQVSFVEATLKAAGFSPLVMDDLDVQWWLRGQYAPRRKVYVLDEEAEAALAHLEETYASIEADEADRAGNQ